MEFAAKPVIGCIGCGNMGSAILSGLARNGQWPLMAYSRTADKITALGSKVSLADNALDLARRCDVIIIAVKPHVVPDILEEITPALDGRKVLVSIAAGVTLAQLRGSTGGACPVVRIMPNTPAMVGMGVFALCFDDPGLDAVHKGFVQSLFAVLGTSLVLPEKRMVAFTALIGAGPAYVFYLMDAMVQAGVTLGFTAAESARLVKALYAGSVAIAQDSPHSLATLREQVCSPAGVTIVGINHMDRTALRGHLIDAVLAVDKRGHDMEEDMTECCRHK